MLQYFFAKKVNGVPTEGLFTGLKVADQPKVMAYQGQYPVLFISFKDIKGKTFEAILGMLKSEFVGLYKAHEYLLDSTKVKDWQKVVFESFLTESAKPAAYKRAFQFLCELLYQHTEKKAILLIDEYDTPIHDAYVHKYYEKCIETLGPLLSTALKGNPYLEKSVITGILKVGKASIFSGLNNVEVHTVLDKGYAQYFGFTEAETQGLLERAGLPQDIPALKAMYNGYQIGDCTLYNPFSIVCFIKEALGGSPDDFEDALRPYWINTSSHLLLHHMIAANLSKLQPGLSQLFQQQPLEAPITTDIVFRPSLKTNTKAFWGLLLLAGYLKATGRRRAEVGPDEEIYSLVFPNREILKRMQSLLIEVVSDQEEGHFELWMKALLEGDIETFSSSLNAYLLHAPSFLDTSGAYKEQFYHGLLLGLLAYLRGSYQITSNRESGLGRYDISLAPLDTRKQGIILELKAAEEGEDLKALAAAAKAQIAEKGYVTEMEGRGITNILTVGISFCGKKAVVV